MTTQEVDSHESTKSSLILLVVELWRFLKVFDRLLSKLDAGEKMRYQSQINWYLKKIDEALCAINCKIVNLEGEKYDVGMAATPLNSDDFENTDVENLYVDQMLEPVIIGKDGDIVRMGTMILKKIG